MNKKYHQIIIIMPRAERIFLIPTYLCNINYEHSYDIIY